MPIHRAKRPNGEVLRYYVPVGTTPEESVSIYAPAALEKQAQGIDPTEPPETTLGGYAKEAGKGILSGAAGLLESAATGAAFLLPEEQEQAARKAIAEYGAEIQADLAPRGGYEDTVVRKLAEATGSTVPFLATAPFGLAGLAAGVATGAAAGAGEAAKRAEAAGATEEQISEAAGYGLLPGLGETIVPFGIGKSVMALRAARGLEKAVGEEVAQTALRRLRRVATSAGAEGLQEASAEVAQNLIAQGVYDPETGTFAGTGESLGYGAGVGGLLAALGELAIPGRPRARGQQEERLALPAPEERLALPAPEKRLALPPPQAKLPYLIDPELFPVTFKDGTVAENQDQYFAKLREIDEQAPKGLTPEEIRNAVVYGGQTSLVDQLIVDTDKTLRQLELPGMEVGDIAPRRSEPAPVSPVEETAAPSVLTKENFVSAGMSQSSANRIPVIKRVVGKDLTDPEVRGTVIADLTAFIENKRVSPANRDAVAKVLERTAPSALQQPLEQLDIEQQIDRDVVEEQARTAEQEREAAFDRAEQEREQPRLDRTAAFEEAEAARKDQRAAEEVMARSEQEFASQPTATALAMQEAERRQQRADEVGRTAPGQQQMEFQAVPPADATIQELQNVEQRISRGQVQEPSTEGQITEQGEMIGPQGGTRTRLPKQKIRPKNKFEDAVVISNLAEGSDLAKYFVGKGSLSKLATKLANDTINRPEYAAKYAKWAQENLSPEFQNSVEKIVAKKLNLDGLDLPIDAIAETDMQVSPEVMQAVTDGNLRTALERMLEGADPTLARTIRAIAKAIGQTTVRMQSGLLNDRGKAIAGVFRPRGNEIILNSDIPLSSHVLLHETVHAVTSHELARNTPAARQMRKLYESVRDRLDTAYGSFSLDEFVAEAFSNPQFQAKLARFNEKGEKITLWQKFKNIVSNIIRKYRGIPAKNIKTTKDSVDKLLDMLVSPAPQYRDAADLHSATLSEMSADVLNSIGRRAEKRGASKQDVATVAGFLRGAGRGARKLAYSFLPMNAIIETIRPDFANLSAESEQLFKLIQEKNGDRSKEFSYIKDTASSIEELLKDKPKVRKVLNFIAGESTILRVDPTKPRSEYAEFPDKQADWDYLNKEINDKLSSEERKIFNKAYGDLRDAYRKVYDDLLATLRKRLDALEVTDEARRNIKDKLFERLTRDGATIEPYFPLYRKGTHWLTYMAVNPRTGIEEAYKELFESEAQRSAAMATLGDIGAKKIETFEQESIRQKISSVDAQWAYGIFEDMQKAGVDQQAQDIVLQALLNAMPEKSALNAFRARKGTLGFENDAMKVFRERMPNFINQKLNLAYDLPFSQASKRIRETSQEYRGTDKQNQAADINELMQEYIQFARNPQLATWSRMLKSAGFGMTLGLNVSSVIVNTTNLPVVVLPYLGGKFGFRASAKAMNQARKNYMATGFKRRRKGFTGQEGDLEFDGPNLTNINFNDPASIPEGMAHYKTLTELLEIRGQANRSTIADALDYDNPSNSLWTKINAVSGYMFHQGERFNRQVTAMAAYDLYLQDLKRKPTQKDYEAAAEYALETTELTNSGAMTETAPRVAQTNWGSVLMMYKRFGISMLYLQARMARQAISNMTSPEKARREVLERGGTREEAEKAAQQATEMRKEARRQIAGLFAMSGLFAGVQGLPLYGILAFIMNTVFLGDEDEDFDSIVARFFGEGMFSGAINAVAGIDIAPRVGMTNLVFRTLPNKEQENIILQGLELFGGPVFGVANRMLDGVGLVGEGEVVRGIERILPSAISNAIKGTRYGIEGATTLRGDPIVEDLNPWNVLAQTFGFAPAEYTKQIEMNARDKRIDRVLAEKKTKLLRRYHLARRVGDIDEMRDIAKEMQEFRRKYPEIGISPESFERSMNQHQITDAITRQLGGITLNRRRIPTVLRQRLEETGD